MTMPPLIEAKPSVMMGKPCIKGTRIPVYILLEKMGAGESFEAILAEYPQIKKEHLQAALQYAAMLAAEEIVLDAA